MSNAESVLLSLIVRNALFAGHDQGAENWACIASLIETCKLNGVDPQAYITDVLTKLVNLWPVSRLDELCPGPRRQAVQPIGSRRNPAGCSVATPKSTSHSRGIKRALTETATSVMG